MAGTQQKPNRNKRKLTSKASWAKTVVSYHVHVDAVGVRPGVLEILLQSLSQWVGDLVEADELFDPKHLKVIPGGARVQPLDDGGHVPEDAGIHQSW